MFDFSFPELLVVMLLGILIIGPKEIPHVIRTLVRTIRWARHTIQQLTQQVMNIDGLEDVKQELSHTKHQVHQIIDLEGNVQDAYDPSDIVDHSRKDEH